MGNWVFSQLNQIRYGQCRNVELDTRTTYQTDASEPAEHWKMILHGGIPIMYSSDHRFFEEGMTAVFQK